MNDNEHKQIGGNHYQRLKYDVMQFGYDIGLEGNVFNLLKYATRHPYKNKQQDIDKAVSYIDFLAYKRDNGCAPKIVIPMSRNFDECFERFVIQFNDDMADIIKAISMWQWDNSNLKETIIRTYLTECAKNYETSTPMDIIRKEADYGEV